MPRSFDNPRTPRPPNRRLRVFAFDPSLSQQIQTADINEVTLTLPWDDGLQEGPIDEYLEVVDVDPASDVCYAPVNLNHPDLLAQAGLPPPRAILSFTSRWSMQLPARPSSASRRRWDGVCCGRPTSSGASRVSTTMNSSAGCASIPTACASPTPITAPKRKRFCLDISLLQTPIPG